MAPLRCLLLPAAPLRLLCTVAADLRGSAVCYPRLRRVSRCALRPSYLRCASAVPSDAKAALALTPGWRTAYIPLEAAHDRAYVADAAAAAAGAGCVAILLHRRTLFAGGHCAVSAHISQYNIRTRLAADAALYLRFAVSTTAHWQQHGAAPFCRFPSGVTQQLAGNGAYHRRILPTRYQRESVAAAVIRVACQRHAALLLGSATGRTAKTYAAGTSATRCVYQTVLSKTVAAAAVSCGGYQ